MKTLITFALIMFVSASIPAVATPVNQPNAKVAPSTECFDFFRVHRQGPGISLSWSAATPGIAQFEIERSYDGEFFETVAAMGCSGTNTHKFNDNDVFPGTIYYRITAVKTNGTSEKSAVKTVRIVQRG